MIVYDVEDAVHDRASAGARLRSGTFTPIGFFCTHVDLLLGRFMPYSMTKIAAVAFLEKTHFWLNISAYLLPNPS